MKTLANRKHGGQERNGLSCWLPSRTAQSWCGAEPFRVSDSTTFAPHERTSQTVFLMLYREALSAPQIFLKIRSMRFVHDKEDLFDMVRRGVCGLGRGFSTEMNPFTDQNADEGRNVTDKKQLCFHEFWQMAKPS